MWSRVFGNPVDWQALLLALLPTLALAWLSALTARRVAASTMYSIIGDAIPPSSSLVRTPLRLVSVVTFVLVAALLLFPALELTGVRPRVSGSLRETATWLRGSGLHILLIVVFAYALCRAVVAKTRYPRRDAMLLIQGDFTDQPEHIPELVKRFEGGADIVVGERTTVPNAPLPVRRLRRVAPWLLRPFVALPGVADPFASFRLVRIAVVRDLIKKVGDGPVVSGAGWAANVDLLSQAIPLARRIETVSLEQRFDIRPRPSRVRPFADALNLYRFAWASRGRRVAPPSTATT